MSEDSKVAIVLLVDGDRMEFKGSEMMLALGDSSTRTAIAFVYATEGEAFRLLVHLLQNLRGQYPTVVERAVQFALLTAVPHNSDTRKMQ